MRRLWAIVALVAACLLIALPLAGKREIDRPIAAYSTLLDGRIDNQRHNAVLCMQEIDGVVIEPGETFSFNDTVGGWTRDKGNRRAPVSFGGILIDSWGGGVCQTSTTLYNAALLAGLEIVERHRHRYAPTYVQPGRDAAVAYPNIDLKFRNPYDFKVTIASRLTSAGVVIEILAPQDLQGSVQIQQRVLRVVQPQEFVLGSGRYGRVRNPGHAGYEVETYRVIDGVKELISVDSYPVMNKVIEYSSPSRGS